MAFNIQSFKSNISSFGYLKPNHFEVGVAPPRFMQGAQLRSSNSVSSVTSMTDRLRFRIDQVLIPGASLLSSEVQVYGIGVQQKMPFNAVLNDSNFTVLVDKKAELWHFWYNWVRYINEFNGTETTAQLRNPSFNVRYKDDYSTTMQIVMYDQEGEVNTRVNLYEAFPSSVREIPLAWNDTGDLMRIAVSITYSSYSIVGSNLVIPNEGARPLGGR
jgi:hypothetical protein